MILALALALLGAALLYLASPHQRLRARPLSPRARIVAATSLVASLCGFVRVLTALTGTFAFVSAVMFWLVVVTYLGALSSQTSKARPSPSRKS